MISMINMGNMIMGMGIEYYFFSHCEERSDEAISPISPLRHCEPKGWQVCWCEAISLLHIPFGVRRSGGIASPDCHQARNDEKEVFARNDAGRNNFVTTIVYITYQHTKTKYC